MPDIKTKTHLHTAALVAGLGLLIMVAAAPFAELYVLPKLIVPGNPAETAGNLAANKSLFAYGVFGYLITFLCDVVVAWALFVFMEPVHENLSMLTSWFRLVYAVISIAALLNLVTVFRLLDGSPYMSALGPNLLNAQIQISVDAFRSAWHFGLLFFGIHLGFLGYLILRSTYVPRILGVLLIIAALGYLTTSLKPFFFPDSPLRFAEYTFFGELVFMLWLLFKGSRLPAIPESTTPA
jgi:hypothetical protein